MKAGQAVNQRHVLFADDEPPSETERTRYVFRPGRDSTGTAAGRARALSPRAVSETLRRDELRARREI